MKKGKSLLSRRAILCGAVLVALCAALPGIVSGSNDCDYVCSTNTVCSGASSACPACDAGVGVSCGDYITEQYNPGGVAIKRADTGGDEEDNNSGQVICFQTASCANGSTIYGAFCAGTGCSGPTPTWCIVCVQSTAWTPSYVTNHNCTACP